MHYIVDRRALLKAATLGLGILALPGAATAIAARGFSHGVASGEPRADSVLLWTRYVGGDETALRCEVSETEDFRHLAGGGDVVARPTSDYCVKHQVSGLSPGRSYYYRFIAPDGTRSETGRTRTLPVGDVVSFTIGLFSCSNLPSGYFNAYGHAAGRPDLDLIVHVGDYIYEYGSGAFPQTAIGDRRAEPDHDIVTLADYRLRYACYRADPDLQRLHRAFPMIAQWDDHEFANNAWMGGAENHDSTSQGDWTIRRTAAERAYREWMPVSDAIYDSYEIGTLATLFKLETRITGRVRQIDPASVLSFHPDPVAAMKAFREGPWSDASRTLMGFPQEQWLADGFAQSTARGTHWQIVAQQAVMGSLRLPTEIESWLPTNLPEKYRPAMNAMIGAARAGLPMSLDSWSGYPAARSRLLTAAQAASANLVVLSGDSHNAWGHDLTEAGQRAGVEFAGHSVSSPGKDMLFPRTPPLDVAKAFRSANPSLRFADTSRRGYVSLTIRPNDVTGEWHFMQDVGTRSAVVAQTHRMQVRKGHRRLQGT